MLRFVDADDRDDAHREIQRNEEHRKDNYAYAARADMHQRVAGEHRADGRDQHGGRGHIDAVEQIDRQRRDPFEYDRSSG